MQIMTFNIQHALDYKRQVIDTDFFVEAIKKYGADICGLNEVRGEGPVEGYTDQTSAIATGLGFNSYFGEAIKVQGTSPYGNAIVSNLPFKFTETIAIPDPKTTKGKNSFESRCIIKAIINFEGKDICFLICHMGLNKSEQKNAVKTICEILDKTVFDFLDDALTEYNKENVLMHKGTPIYFNPDFDVKTVTAFSVGVTIGEIKKNYIQPHHQLFMAMGESFKRKINLSADSEDVKKYLHGEELSVDCPNGWAVVMVDGCALGGAKVSNGRAKNHYPKGLRTK